MTQRENWAEFWWSDSNFFEIRKTFRSIENTKIFFCILKKSVFFFIRCYIKRKSAMDEFVINEGKTSHLKCRDKSWLSYWKRGTGQELPGTCYVQGCRRPPQVGAHVRHESDLREIWIIPFCMHHNKHPMGLLIELKYGALLCGGNTKIDCL